MSRKARGCAATLTVREKPRFPDSQKSLNRTDREESPFNNNSDLYVKFLITNTLWKTLPLSSVQQIFPGT